jgi:hypothetical protein
MKWDKAYKYKGYKIEKDFDYNGRMTLWTAKPHDEFLKKRRELEKQKIVKEWHGGDCFCSKCTLTEQEAEHQTMINEKISNLILSMRVNSITCNTMKECKAEIDKLEK